MFAEYLLVLSEYLLVNSNEPHLSCERTFLLCVLIVSARPPESVLLSVDGCFSGGGVVSGVDPRGGGFIVPILQDEIREQTTRLLLCIPVHLSMCLPTTSVESSPLPSNSYSNLSSSPVSQPVSHLYPSPDPVLKY